MAISLDYIVEVNSDIISNMIGYSRQFPVNLADGYNTNQELTR